MRTLSLLRLDRPITILQTIACATMLLVTSLQAQDSIRAHARQHPLPIDAVRWTDGFWADRFQLCQEVVIPEMKKALHTPGNGARLENFEIAAGVKKGKHLGSNWGDGDCYKWIEAMAWCYAVSKNEAFDREMDLWIDLIAKTQDEDGYIGTQTQLNPEKDRWGQRVYHELYNHGHLLTAASVHKQATGKDSFLDVARKLGDYLDRTFKERPKELAHFGWNPSNIMGLVDLYRATGEPRYLKLAGTFIDMRGSVPWPQSTWGLPSGNFDPHPGDQNQDRTPLRLENEAVGHAVTGLYLWCGAADVCAETGDQELLASVDRIWEDIVYRKMYITGGVGAYHHGISPNGDMVHEAFGRAFELPNRTAYNETCANISNAMLSHRLMLLTGDAKYADVLERVVYNSGISGMSLDGRLFCYANPLARRHDLPLLSHDTEKRWATLGCYCCPVSVARTLAKMHYWAYAASDAALYVNLYGGNTVVVKVPNAGRLKLTQTTDYPWNGNVVLTLQETPPTPMSIYLRIPGWAGESQLMLNGQSLELTRTAEGYAIVKRQWRAGDKLALRLLMKPQMYEGDPRIEETRNQVAIMRGPVVYCLESIDLPKGTDIDRVAIARDATWRETRASEELVGIPLLETEALYVTTARHRNEIYRPLSTDEPRRAKVRLVPYFAWNNRDTTEMRVWIPVR